MTPTKPGNFLYYGDCLDIMREMRDRGELVDLIYLDPPFNSNRDYNTLYTDETGYPLPEQVQAFTDTWEWSAQHGQALARLPATGMADPGPLMALIPMLQRSQPSMAAYMVYMAERLALMRFLLRDTGNIYLHCDSTANSYLRLTMDCVFGAGNFRNEVIWHYGKMANPKHVFPRNHDTILRYSKTNDFKFNPISGGDSEYRNRYKRFLTHDNKVLYGSVRTSTDKLVLGRAKKIRKELGRELRDSDVLFDFNTEFKVQSDVIYEAILKGNSAERLGFPTQKPLGLLNRIVESSSEPGDVVFDPFCGCGTTIEAAQNLERRWIGVDITIHAVRRVSRRRLQMRCGLLPNEDYTLSGIPNSVESAAHLHGRDPYHYQIWAVEEVGGFPTPKASRDGGIDGTIWFYLPNGSARRFGQMVVEVKGGQPKVADLRALIGVLEKTPDVDMAGLIVQALSPSMRNSWERNELAGLPRVRIGIEDYPPVQILTIEDVLAGKRFETPTRAAQEGKVQIRGV